MGNLFDGCGGREPEPKKETKEFFFDDEINNMHNNTDYYDDEYIIEYSKTKINNENNTKIKTYDF